MPQGIMDRTLRDSVRSAVLPQKWDLTVGRDALFTLGLTLAVTVGIIVRAFYILPSDFPLNDGGLFYRMVVDLKQAGYHLPDFTSYNAAGIPYAYPPLSFYIAAALSEAPIPLMDLLRYIPFVVSSATIVAFYLLARGFLSSRLAQITAVCAFALVPRSFTWSLMGGGLTRSFGLLFALLALHQMHRLYTTGRSSYFVGATLFCAGTVLSHLGTAPFLAFSILLLLVFHARTLHAVWTTLAVAAGTLLLTAPWWATVLATHGMAPFLAASASGGSIFGDSEVRRGVLGLLAHLGVGSWYGSSTGETLFPIVGTLALFGAIFSLVRMELFLPVWWLAILVLEPRAGSTYASIPVAMLAGMAMRDVVLPIVEGHRDGGARRPLLRDLRRPAILVLALILSYATISALLKNFALGSDLQHLAALSAEERAAMAAAAARTAPSSRFLVIPETQWIAWEVDKTSEWFPVLTERVSVATVQGSEWLPDREFIRRRNLWKELRACAAGIVTCIEDWSRHARMAYTHIYIPQPTLPGKDAYKLCCNLLIDSLKSDPRYTLIFDGPGALIFARRDRG